MATATLSPTKRAQYSSDGGGWSESTTTLTLLAGKESTGGTPPYRFDQGAIGFNVSNYYGKSTLVVSAVKLLITPAYNIPGTIITAPKIYSALSDINIVTPSNATRTSVSGTSVVTVTIPTSALSYAEYFGVWVNYEVNAINYGTINRFSFKLEITYTQYSTYAPDTLSPNNVNRNPKAVIPLSWRYVSSGAAGDTQTNSVMRYNINNGAYTSVTIPGKTNAYTFPSNRFADGNIVRWQVQTTSNMGTSGWSAVALFNIAITPPLPSTLIFPLNISVSGINGIPLEWRYNSPYDTFPTQFDIRYNLDGGEWVYGYNYSSENRPAYQSFMTEAIITQDKATWQVRAHGEWGDIGEWSDIGTFFTIGAPDAPTIVSVTNSNRPTINFSAENIMSWELQITDGTKVLYNTGSQPFLNEFSHRMTEFLSNGNYVSRMRITNEFGLQSEWAELAFTINTIAPDALTLQIVDNPTFYIRLRFDNVESKTVYIYRSEFQQNKYMRIDRTTDSVFDDYTVRPQQRYEYFVRVVTADDSFADSNIDVGMVGFMETTIAEYTRPDNMLMFLFAMDGKPTKDISFGFEKSLTQFVGREKPVLQIGSHTNKNLSLLFFCAIATFEQLSIMHTSDKILLLRDWRLGSVYGTINGEISASRETNGCNVSFVFTEVDFNEEVDLI